MVVTILHRAHYFQKRYQRVGISGSPMKEPVSGGETIKCIKQVFTEPIWKEHHSTVKKEKGKNKSTDFDSSSRLKINKKIAALDDTLDQMDLINVFRTFHSKAAKYTSF